MPSVVTTALSGVYELGKAAGEPGCEDYPYDPLTVGITVKFRFYRPLPFTLLADIYATIPPVLIDCQGNSWPMVYVAGATQEWRATALPPNQYRLFLAEFERDGGVFTFDNFIVGTPHIIEARINAMVDFYKVYAPSLDQRANIGILRVTALRLSNNAPLVSLPVGIAENTTMATDTNHLGVGDVHVWCPGGVPYAANAWAYSFAQPQVPVSVVPGQITEVTCYADI